MGYRKLRNTARFALGNLHGFDPARTRCRTMKWRSIAGRSRSWTACSRECRRLTKHTSSQRLSRSYNFSTVTLSARYFDIIKDRLYTLRRVTRRVARQTALLRIADALARTLAPILVFTADEIWENLPHERKLSVHIAEFPVATKVDELLAKWERVFDIRDQVLRKLEEASGETDRQLARGEVNSCRKG